MKKLVLLLMLVFGLNGSLFADGPCEIFIPADKWQYIDSLEQDGICMIDENTDLGDLMFTSTDKAFNQDFQREFTALKNGNSLAVLVSNDMLYSMEEGNECWSCILGFFKGKKTGGQADVSPHHGKMIEENQRLRAENRRQRRELNRHRAAERARRQREWQEKADRWSREHGTSPR